MTAPVEGDVYTYERTFTVEDVRRFAEVSRDTQPIHTEPDEDGRLVVHGLLTATMPTKIGGDLEVLARSMTFEFRRRVLTGDTVTCEWRNETVEEGDDRYEVVGAIACRNQDDEVVLTGSAEGIVWKD